MDASETDEHNAALRHRQEQIQKYWAGDLSRQLYRLRRQRKAFLENCRRIAVVGVNTDAESASFVAIERSLGMGWRSSRFARPRKPPGSALLCTRARRAGQNRCCLGASSKQC
jgi:hypothetical protein